MDVRRQKDMNDFILENGPSVAWHSGGRVCFYENIEAQGTYYRNEERQTVEISPGRYIFKGLTRNGEKNGIGVMVDIRQQLAYRGEWRNNKFDGKGSLLTEHREYHGFFLKGVQQGKGFELFENGDTYEGQYHAGYFDGKGKYVWKNGNSYQGEFRKGCL